MVDDQEYEGDSAPVSDEREAKFVNDIDCFAIRPLKAYTPAIAKVLLDLMNQTVEAIKEELDLECQVVVFKKKNVFERVPSIVVVDKAGRIKEGGQ